MCGNCSKNCNSNTTSGSCSNTGACSCGSEQQKQQTWYNILLGNLFRFLSNCLSYYKGRQVIRILGIYITKYELNSSKDKWEEVNKKSVEEKIGVQCTTLAHKHIPYSVKHSKPLQVGNKVGVITTIYRTDLPYLFGLYCVIGFGYMLVRVVYEVGLVVNEVFTQSIEGIGFKQKVAYIVDLVGRALLLEFNESYSRIKRGLIGLIPKSGCIKVFLITLALFLVGLACLITTLMVGNAINNPEVGLCLPIFTGLLTVVGFSIFCFLFWSVVNKWDK